MAEPLLVTVELRFVSSEDPSALGDRLREAAAMIVGREAIEDFRVRSMPLTPPETHRPPAV
jgi:hypothetical protein